MYQGLNYACNHSRWTSLSKFRTIAGEQVADQVRTSLENEFQAREREAVQVKLEKSEAQDIGGSHSDVHPTKKRKTTRGLLEELVLSTRSDARAEQTMPHKGGCVHGDQGAQGGTRNGGPCTQGGAPKCPE